MGTCLSTQSTTRRTRRRGVSISAATAGEQGNNCGGRSGDDNSVSQQQQGGSSDSVTSTSPAPGASGPSTRAGGGNGERFPTSQSGQEWTLIQSSPPLPSCSRIKGTVAFQSSSREEVTSNPLPPGAQILLPVAHTRLSSPFVANIGDTKHQSESNNVLQAGQQHCTPPPSNTYNNIYNNDKEISQSNTTTANARRNQLSTEEEEGEDVVVVEEEEEGNKHVGDSTVRSLLRQPVERIIFTTAGTSRHDVVQDGNRLTADQLSLKSAEEEEELEVSSVCAGAAEVPFSAAPPENRGFTATAAGVPTGNHQGFLGSSFASSGIYSGSASCGAGAGAGGGSAGSGGGDTVGSSRVVFGGSGGGGSIGRQAHHRQHSSTSPPAMVDGLRTNNPNCGSPSPSNIFPDAAGIRGGGRKGRGSAAEASAHGDPKLDPSMCSSWDSFDCSRAQISQADAQTTMQTVATASLFASSIF